MQVMKFGEKRILLKPEHKNLPFYHFKFMFLLNESIKCLDYVHGLLLLIK